MTTTTDKTNLCNSKQFFVNTKEREDYYRTAKNYTENFEQNHSNGYGLYINGTERLRLAAMVQQELQSQGKSIYQIKTDDLLYEIRKACDSDEDIGPYTLSGEADVLVLHDFDKSSYTHQELQTLFNFISHQYEKLKPMIITTVLDYKNLAKAITQKSGNNAMSEAIVRRIASATIYLNV